jgi:hypothetical protein
VDTGAGESSVRRIGFGLLTAVLVFGVIEGSARVFMAGLDPTGFDDASWRSAWLRDHSGRGEIFYGFDRFDPSKGWISKPNLRDQPVFDGETLSTNSLGLRGRSEIDAGVGLGDARVLLLGDSFTFGDEVSDAETYASHLDESLGAARVINFGVHGYAHDQMLILLREHGRLAQPDIVVLGFVYADIHRNLLNFRDFAKPHFEFADGALALRGMPLPTPDEVLSGDLLRPAVWDVWTVARGMLDARSGALDERARELTRHILDALLLEIRAIGALPVFVYLPVEAEIENQKQLVTSRERFLLDYCRDRGVDCASLRLLFARAHAAGPRLKTLGHWGPRGHRIAAEGIANFVSPLLEPIPPADSKRIGRGLEKAPIRSSTMP